ncbi:SPOR domain-containing protein [Marinomonas sp. M1K-6]|uniref:SPOR domain-containing protein n=1 Tax=Marinomonas profundi TaxID=2726122 RepID=A0A847R4F6_9GAMM|nr:SPOR domain-containing protein [Marinomonas profundi]NLQ16896.1 SPOR domain-containing protein [Marinomonas profundi]UDV02628.1 SPOR domain-containing protein [Marinomonas profundi]
MGISKKLIIVMAALSLGACSSMSEKNTFMTYDDLQEKVRIHEEQWQAIQPKLDRIDALEAEVATLKGDQPVSSASEAESAETMGMDEGIAAADVAPVVTPVPLLIESDEANLTAAEMTTQPAMTGSAMTESAPESEPVVKAPPQSKFGVQVASYGNRDEAIRGWQVLEKAHPTSFQGLQPLVNQKEVNGRTMYQLKVGPFIDKSFSSDFCKMLKEKGKDCLLTQYNGETFVRR